MTKKEREIQLKKKILSLFSSLNLYIKYIASKNSRMINKRSDLNKRASSSSDSITSFWEYYSDHYFYLEDLINLDILLLQNVEIRDLSILKM